MDMDVKFNVYNPQVPPKKIWPPDHQFQHAALSGCLPMKSAGHQAIGVLAGGWNKSRMVEIGCLNWPVQN